MKLSIAIVLSVVGTAAFGQSWNIDTYRVVGSEQPGVYKHPASITELANGDLLLAYYGGSGEYGDDTAVYGVRLGAPRRTHLANQNNNDGRRLPHRPLRGRTSGDELENADVHWHAGGWSTPWVLADTPDRGEGNPVIWQAPDGLLWLFYVNRYGDTWSNARVKVKRSNDGGHSWSDSALLNMEEGSMVRGQPIVLNDGDYLLPMYHETGEDRELSGSDTVSYFMRYNPATKVWSESSRIHSTMGNLQAQVVQITDDYLIAYLRRGGNFEPTDRGYTLRSESRDGGHTWSEAVETKFKNPNSAVDFIRLKNGHLLLVYNDNMNERTPLTVAISMDNDKTYPYRRDIAGGDNTFAYPYAIQSRDGKIHIIYTTNERRTIMHAVFDEHAIIGSPPEL